MSEFTKGPWKVKEIEDNGGTFLVNCDTPRMSGGAASNGNNWVATVWTPKTGKKYSAGHRTRTLHDYREAEANAHLIAESPAMFEILEHITTDGAELTPELIQSAKEIISKIEGRE